MFSFIIDLIQTIVLIFIGMIVFLAFIKPYKVNEKGKMVHTTYWLEKLADSIFKEN